MVTGPVTEHAGEHGPRRGAAFARLRMGERVAAAVAVPKMADEHLEGDVVDVDGTSPPG